MLYGCKKNVCYIRMDNRKYNKYWYIIIKILRKIFIRVGMEYVENGIVMLIPEYKTKRKKLNSIINKSILEQILKKLENSNIEYIAVEEGLENIGKAVLECDKLKYLNMLNGKYLMKIRLKELWKYIFEASKKNSSMENLYIFVKKYSQENINIIRSMIPMFRTVNIITSSVRKYRILEENLYNKGILVTVSNNRRKSARNAKYIINIDMESCNIQQYLVNNRAIIINLTNEINLMPKSFQGVIVNNAEFELEKEFITYIEEFYGKISSKVYIESLLASYYKVNNTNFENLKITYLYGVRGRLTKVEFLA